MTSETNPADDWSAVAGAWDENTDYVDRHSLPATEAMIAALDVRQGDRVLELAAGPGTLGAQWSRLTGPAGRVVLSDVAPAMVEVARRRNVGATNVEVTVLDATSIDRDDGSFDAVACRMGLMFAPDPAIALGEIRRVLDSGGRFAALTWAGMERNPWMTCVGMAAAMHGVAAGPPPVAAGGVFSLGDEEQLRALARSARFADVEVTALPTVFEAPDIDTHLARVSSLAGPLAAAFAAATPAQLDAVRETAAQLTAEHARDDGALALPGCALLLTARA